MNKRASLLLRAMVDEQPPFPAGDPRNQIVLNRLKKCYNRLPAPDRHPDRLKAALERAIANETSQPFPAK